MVETINRWRARSASCSQKLEREPTPRSSPWRWRSTPERIVQILKIAQEPVSLETPVGDEDGRRARRTSSRTTSTTRPHQVVITKLRGEELEDVLSHALAPRAQGARAALRPRRRATPERSRRSAAHFGVTRERVRQIESRALMKLKSYREAQRLRD